MKYITLNNDIKMPIIGLGTWKSEPTKLYSAIRWALKLGYTHFDCASIYHNEEAIGSAIHDAIAEDGIKREELFITSKLWNNNHKKEDVSQAFNETLKRLQTSYLDLYLMHWPVAQKKDALMPLNAEDMLSLDDVPLTETWEAMVKLYDEGKIKAIGVSNFGINSLQEIIKNSTLNPMVNQIETHPYLPQEKLIDFCKQNQIAVTAYAPLGSGNQDILKDETIVELAKKLNATPAQILLAYNLNRNIAVIPKTTSEKHLRENIASLNIGLDENDMNTIKTIKNRERYLSSDVFKIGAYADVDIFA